MDLDEYLWRSRTKNIEMAMFAKCSPNALCKIRKRNSSASLLIAIKLSEASEGQITMLDLLSNKDKEAYEKWNSEKIDKNV